MSNPGSPAGWVVRVRTLAAPGAPQWDEFYLAAIADPREAEEQVRDAVQVPNIDRVDIVKPLSASELSGYGLQAGQIRRGGDDQSL